MYIEISVMQAKFDSLTRAPARGNPDEKRIFI